MNSASIFASSALLVLASAAQQATAGPINFDIDPFSGSTALTTAGRQVYTGLERTLPSFSFSADTFVFNLGAFGNYGIGGSLSFLNSPASGIPGAGANVIVLQDVDNDANATTPFAAGTAANLIAARVNTDGAGFFIYHNSVLDVNRLVFSTNLNDATADLSVLARIASPSGLDAVYALPQFGSGNFAAAVPEPSSLALLAAGLCSVGFFSRRRRA